MLGRLIRATFTTIALSRTLQSVKMESRYITKQTKIINIGHLPGHVNGKTDLLREAGWSNSVGIITLETTKEAIKAELKSSPGALFIVGGAMNKEYPELMAELNEFIKSEVPSIIVHNTTKEDFPEGCPLPPTEGIIAASGVTIANRLLRKEEEL